jgi:ribosomal protein L7/L12
MSSETISSVTGARVGRSKVEGKPVKACPFCAEEIQDAAIVCKHCGRDLPTSAPPTAAAPAWEAEARALARDKPVHAIQRVREETGLGLKEAKDLVDRWRAGETAAAPKAPASNARKSQSSMSPACLGSLVLFGLVAVLTGFASVRSCVQPTPPPDPTKAAAAPVTVICEHAVKSKLRSPGTADFPFGHGSGVVARGGNEYRLASHVDSQNAFGGIVRTNFVCDVVGAGDDMSDFRLKNIELLPN